jgi:hypothetical protein
VALDQIEEKELELGGNIYRSNKIWIETSSNNPMVA